jgi:hypothetical protein
MVLMLFLQRRQWDETFSRPVTPARNNKNIFPGVVFPKEPNVFTVFSMTIVHGEIGHGREMNIRRLYARMCCNGSNIN